MNEIIFIVEESTEGGYTARALGESIVTEAETMEELKRMIRDAVKCHFDDENLPRIIRLHFVKEEVLPV
ncbi:MAG: 2-oxoisovalerate dehydrogenase [Bacteroidota bacterium]